MRTSFPAHLSTWISLLGQMEESWVQLGWEPWPEHQRDEPRLYQLCLSSRWINLDESLDAIPRFWVFIRGV